MKVEKEDIKKAGGCLHLYTGQGAGCEATLLAMHGIFESNKTGNTTSSRRKCF